MQDRILRVMRSARPLGSFVDTSLPMHKSIFRVNGPWEGTEREHRQKRETLGPRFLLGLPLV